MNFETLQKYTNINKDRLKYLIQKGEEVKDIPGDIVECGVMHGGSLAAMAYLNDKSVWGFDSFQGCPEPGEHDIGVDGAPIAQRGLCRGDKKRVWDVFKEMRLDADRLHLIEGWFEDTLPIYKGNIAFLHIDGDWYESTKTCLIHLYDKVSPGGWICVDDYGYWLGSNLAVHEFVADKNITLERFTKNGVWWKKQ